MRLWGGGQLLLAALIVTAEPKHIDPTLELTAEYLDPLIVQQFCMQTADSIVAFLYCMGADLEPN